MNNREKLEREYFNSNVKICFEDWLICELVKIRAAEEHGAQPALHTTHKAQNEPQSDYNGDEGAAAHFGHL